MITDPSRQGFRGAVERAASDTIREAYPGPIRGVQPPPLICERLRRRGPSVALSRCTSMKGKPQGALSARELVTDGAAFGRFEREVGVALVVGEKEDLHA